MIKTVIIDSEKAFQDRIKSTLLAEGDFAVVGQGKDAYDALKLISCFKPDIAILDHDLEYIGGEEIPPLLRARSPLTTVVILTTKTSDSQLHRAAASAVSGLIHKKEDIDLLPWILRRVSNGGCFISPSLAARVLRILAPENRVDTCGHPHPAAKTSLKNAPETVSLMEDPARYLSKTELQILTCVGEGISSGEIAETLDLAVGTVRNYISAVMHKTGLHNRSEMVRFAFKYGLVPLA